jgi:hypothetical protein
MFRSGGRHFSNSIMWTRWRTASLWMFSRSLGTLSLSDR